MKRRDFLKRTGSAITLAAITGGTGFLFHNLETSTYQAAVSKSRGFEVPHDTALPKVVLARNEDHIAALNQSLDAIGGIKRFVKPGERVTIKPNIGWDRTPQQAANTNPVLVAEMVRRCLSAGASEVIVSDITCNDPRRTFLRSGIREAAENAGARVLLPSEDDYINIDIGGKLLTSWPVLKHFVETDRLINMPIVKQHSLSTCTISMKNLYGIIGGQRHRLHQDIDQSIVDLAAFARPTLTVVDATRVLLRNGPQGGSLSDVAEEHTVICATDQVAADSRAVEFLGYTGELVSHIMLAQTTGLGTIDYRNAGYKEIVS
ncbi:MAG: DUF362 domain-containing protein [candidate division Zixibacteria bacterium]|nr:DUF362 domain-containing protein [candidate division Zixibacteria bacterium]